MEKIQVRPGYLVQNTSRATGGVTYNRRKDQEQPIHGGEGYTQRMVTDKTVDHVEMVRLVQGVAGKADYACRKNCAMTTFGWFTTEESLAALRAEFDALRIEADEVNWKASQAGCARRVHVGYVISKLDLAHEDTAREVARTIREVLTDLRDALRSGYVSGAGAENKLRAPLARAKGLDRLAVGISGESVKAALASIVGAKEAIKASIDAGQSPESAGSLVELGAIENAIAWFEEGGISGDESGSSDGGSDPVTLALAACS